MECYPCLQAGITREAAGLCHHCPAALCSEHICEVEEPIVVSHPLVPDTVFPRKARILLCPTCKSALEQVGSEALHV